MHKELEDLEASETCKLKKKVVQAKEKGRDLLQVLSAIVNLEISENQRILDKLIAQCKKIMEV